MSNQSFQAAFEKTKDFNIVTNFTPLDDISFPTPTAGLTAFYFVLLVILETFANFLLFCLIWYEKYGMDSQKRTVTNQLLSSMCMAAIFHNTFITPISTINMIIGPSKFSPYTSKLMEAIFTNVIA